MAQFKYKDIVLDWVQESGLHLIRLRGDNHTKVLYSGPNMGQASKVFRETQAHYEQQEREEKARKLTLVN